MCALLDLCNLWVHKGTPHQKGSVGESKALWRIPCVQLEKKENQTSQPGK